jgi:hypothetical protein
MFLAFFALVMLNGAIGILCWLAIQRVRDHMGRDPQAASLVAQHVIAPLLMRKKKLETEDGPDGEAGHTDAGYEHRP